MSWRVGPISPIDAVALAQTRDGAPSRGDFAAALEAEGTPGARGQPLGAVPPPEALGMLEAAQHAILRLHEQGRDLHFEVHDGELRIEVRDLDGRVLARVPPGQALDLLTAAPPTEDLS